MNNTSKTAKELVEEVKKLTPIVQEKKKQAEEQAKIADKAEKEANVVLETQKDEKSQGWKNGWRCFRYRKKRDGWIG